MTGVFKLWAPRLHALYRDMLDTLNSHHPHLRRNFENSVFAAATANLGPRTVTRPHIDHLNLPNGWCAITALGRYDHTRGGHLVLWDLKLIIEFPPGSTILIPSSIFKHSNLPIADDEVRYSFTQYSAGGLFRWVANGFQSQKAFDAAGQKHEDAGQTRWMKGMDLFSTMEEIQQTAGL